MQVRVCTVLLHAASQLPSAGGEERSREGDWQHRTPVLQCPAFLALHSGGEPETCLMHDITGLSAMGTSEKDK